MDTNLVIEVKDVHKSFKTVQAVRGVDLGSERASSSLSWVRTARARPRSSR